MTVLIVPTTSALLTLKMPTMMVVLLNLLIQAARMNLHAQWTPADLKDANKSSITLLAMMELLALKIFVHLAMKMLTKTDAFTLSTMMFAMMKLIALTIFALLPLKTQMKTDALTKQLIQDVMMVLDAPEMPATQNQKMQWMDALTKAWTVNVMMDLHALRTLAHLKAKVLMKMDVYLLLTLLIVKIALSAHQMYVPQEVKMQTAMVVYLPKLIPDAMMDLHAR